MRVLIVSDTHKRNEYFYVALEQAKPDLVIHCGDAEGYEDELIEAAGCPVRVVLGNNDFFSALPREIVTDIGPYKAWILHGHNYRVSMGNEMLKQEAVDRGIDLVFYGHTHKPVVDTEGGVIAVNPGSLAYPRQEGRRPSYAVMDINEKDELSISIEYI